MTQHWHRTLSRVVSLLIGAASAHGCASPTTAAPKPGAPVFTLAPPTVVPVPVDAAGRAKETPDLSRFALDDIFELEWASDPRISPDAKQVVYLRRFMDRMKDVRRANLWIVEATGQGHRPLVTGNLTVSQPRWSPSGDRLAYVTAVDGKVQIIVRWMDTGQTMAVTRLTESPSNLAWSPDGRSIAFTARVPGQTKPLVKLPSKPKGAEWAAPPKVVDQLVYRFDGAGYLKPGYNHVFVVPADGGTPRQLSTGDYHHNGTPAWTPDGSALVISANRNDDWAYRPLASDLWSIDIATGAMTRLTTREGPDDSPQVSPDGRTIAFIGFDDKKLGFHTRRLHLLDRKTGNKQVLLPKLDRTIRAFRWSADGSGLFVLYDDRGTTHLAFRHKDGRLKQLAKDIGGTTIGRPYASGSFTVARNGAYAYTLTSPKFPADIAVGRGGRRPTRLTRLNDDLLGRKVLGDVESITVNSSAKGLPVQGWILKPPGFDPSKKYPLILEIHGGPFTNYGDRFSAECQLYAAAGYVVVYANPRGSTSYGEARSPTRSTTPTRATTTTT